MTRVPARLVDSLLAACGLGRDRRLRGPGQWGELGIVPVLGSLPSAGLSPAGLPAPPRDATAARPPADAPSSACVRVSPPLTPAPLGQMLVSAGLLHPPEVERILAWSRQEGLRFGEAAVARRLVTAEQVDRVLAAQSGVAVLTPGASPVAREVVAAYALHAPLVDELHRIRARIRAVQDGGSVPPGPRGFAVVSPDRGDGRTFLAANLAVAFAQGGQRTLLIDADLRHGRLHRLFGVSNAAGLSSLLSRSLQPGWLQTVPGLPGLSLLPCGPAVSSPGLLLTRDVFDPLLGALGLSFDQLIFDTPCTTEEPDATLIAQRIGAAVVLGRQGRTRHQALADWRLEAEAAHLNLLGAVLNRG